MDAPPPKRWIQAKSELDPVDCQHVSQDFQPRAESVTRAIALIAIIWGVAYLIWRIGWTWQGTNALLYFALLAAELTGFVSLGFFAMLAWSPNGEVHDGAAVLDTLSEQLELSVDLLVPTYDESADVLRATLIGCRAVRYPHRTWLLDDGNRTEIKRLAEELEVEYVTRPDNSHAKAGNINHVLPLLDGDLIGVLDADHVPLPGFVDEMISHFKDPEVALVQAPHEFYNIDSVQHVEGEIHEQSLFFRVICPTKDRSNSVFWCGSGTLIRRDALIGVGGVQTATIAEDFHTTIKLHQQGWSTRYVNRTLLLGLAPHDLSSFLLQRSRWARGNLRVFLTKQNPVVARQLTLRQRLSYLGSLIHYFGGPQRLALLCVLCITLATGVLPLHGPPILFAVLWAPWVALSLYATRRLGRGYSGPLRATVYGWMTMGVYSSAVASLAFPSFGKFKVTPKGGTDEGGLRVLGMLRLLSVMTLALVVTSGARLAAISGLMKLPPMPTFASIATLVIAAFELTVIFLVLRSLARHRQRRVSFRFPVSLAAKQEDRILPVLDLNLHGAAVGVDQSARIGDLLELDLQIPGLDGTTHPTRVQARVQSLQSVQSGRADHGHGFEQRAGIAFESISVEASTRILEYCHVLLPAQQAATGAVLDLPLADPHHAKSDTMAHLEDHDRREASGS